jgi:hypothetical protein
MKAEMKNKFEQACARQAVSATEEKNERLPVVLTGGTVW